MDLSMEGVAAMSRAEMLAAASALCLVEQVDDVGMLDDEQLRSQLQASIMLFRERFDAPIEEVVGLTQHQADDRFVPDLAGIVPWVSIIEWCDGSDVTVVERCDDDGIQGSFHLAVPVFHYSTDALIGSTYLKLPAAQQYAMRASAAVAKAKRHAAALAQAVNEPF
jgi:hypothetical protein